MTPLTQGSLWRSDDRTLVFNIFKYHRDFENMTIDIHNDNLDWIMTVLSYPVSSFIEEISIRKTIIPY